MENGDQQPGARLLARDPNSARSPDTPSSVEDKQLYLTFRLGQEWYALPVYHLVEVMAKPVVTRVPTVPRQILGVFNLRGEVLTALDPKVVLGIDSPPGAGDEMLVITELQEVRTGLLVDEIGDLVEMGTGELMNHVGPGHEGHRDLIASATRWRQKVVAVLDLEALLRAAGLQAPEEGA